MTYKTAYYSDKEAKYTTKITYSDGYVEYCNFGSREKARDFAKQAPSDEQRKVVKLLEVK